METRLPLTPEEIVHQSLLDQMKTIPNTNDDNHSRHQQNIYSTILHHVERQVYSMFPSIFDNDTNIHLYRRIIGRLTDMSMRQDKFTSRQNIKEEIEQQLKSKYNEHIEKLFRHFGSNIEDRYRNLVMSKLQHVNIHPDHAKNLIKFLLDNGKDISFIEDKLVNYPFYSKLKETKSHPIETRFSNVSTNYHMFLVQSGFKPNSHNYLEYFEELIKDLIKEHKRFNLPYAITNGLASACETGFKKDPDNRTLIYNFIETGSEKEIMELIDGLRQTKTYCELPDNYGELDEYFRYNIELFKPFNSILITAITANKGFTPVISKEYDETISF